MAQYDLLITQNVHATGVEFTEKYVNVGKGDLLSGIATTKAPTVLAAGTNGHMLVRDDAEVTGLKWIAIQAGHTQGTDTGTTATFFELDSDGYKIELTAESASKFGAKVDGGATYADFQAKDATFASASVNAAPTLGDHLTNKTYVDGILAAYDAMIFKGTIGTGGTHTLVAFNALTTYNSGWTYRVIEAGTIRGKVCEIGDLITVIVDRTGTGNVDGDFTAMQTNLDGAVIGPASTTDNYVALFSGTTGKLLKAGTGALGTAAYVATGTFATAAQGTTADAAIPKATFTATGNEIILGSAASTYAPLALGTSTFFGRKASGNASALTVAEAQTLLTLGSAAYVATGTFATAAQGTTADGAVPKSLLTAAEQMLISTGVSTPASLAVGASTFVGRKAAGSISAMSVAEAKTLLAYGTAANNATGDFATSAQGTLATNAIPKGTFTEQGDILYASGASTPAALAHGNAGQVLQSGGNAANPSWLTLGTMAAETAANYVLNSLYDAYSMLMATTDNTPVAMTVAEQTIVGRKTGGAIAALTPAEVINVICVTAPATKTSNGWAGQIAFDANYFYRCLTGTGGAGTWMRTAMATNW